MSVCLAQSKPKRAENPSAVIAGYYASLNAAYKANSFQKLRQWFTTYTSSGFTYTSFQRQTFKREPFITGLKDQVKAIQSVSVQTINLGKGTRTGDTFKVQTSGTFEGVVIFDGKPLLMTDNSESADVWIRESNTWKLLSVKVTKEDVQMREHK